MTNGRVFVLESPNALDLLEERGERDALTQVCRLVGHKAQSFIIRDLSEFKQTCAYISAIEGDKDDMTPLFIHFSLHGNSTGIGCGRDTVDWNQFSTIVSGMYQSLKYYHGPVIIILSACGANKQKLTWELTQKVQSTRNSFVPPEYVFVFTDEDVAWLDAVVTWTIFYREAPKINFLTDRLKVQQLIDRLRSAGFGNLKYFRWDITEHKYKSYPKN